MADRGKDNLASALAGGQIDDKRARQGASFAICTVEDSFAHAGSYIVRLPAGRLISAVDLHPFACLPMGSRPISAYPPKARVLTAYIPGLNHAIILGSVPKQLSDPSLILPESMVLRSMVGIFQDPLHYNVFTDPHTDLGNHSAGRPADVLSGDWGVINDLGAAVFVGRLMATMKASDAAKLEAFWGDDLLRLTGYNFELFTAGAEERRINDEGEYNEIARIAMFPWEGMGLRTLGDATTAANGKLQPNSDKAKYEPKQPDQLMVQRGLRLRGYLGDLDREFVCAPPVGLSTESYSARTAYAGLLDIAKSSSGAIAIRSAKELIFEKYALLPVPKEMIAPEDPLGDNPTNYKAGDMQGGGAGYQLPEYVWGDDNDANIRSAQMYDYHSYLLGKYTLNAVAAHKNDWFLPDEGDMTVPVTTVLYDKSLAIGHQFMAPLPGFGELVIDQRPGHTVRYYRSRSAIHQLDDGSVVLEDGYGSQIVMKGGSIFFSCVGDVWAQPGRNFVAWAPHDAILRAGNSADISASKHDVRIKAERNMHILAGNDTSRVGGVLIESRSQGAPSATDFAQIGEQVQGHGIVLKAVDSSIQAFGHDVYIGRNQKDTGNVVIDAGKQGNLYLRGAEVLTRATQLLAFMIESDSGPAKQMMAINQAAAVVSAPMEIGGTVVIAKAGDNPSADLFVGGNLTVHDAAVVGTGVVTNGAFAARKGAPFVGKLNNDTTIPDPSTYANNINKEVTAVSKLVDTEEKLAVDSASSSPGNDDFQKAVGFSCRDTIRDLKLDANSFIIYESRWQQMLRHSGGQKTWDEPIVQAPAGQQTRPHPGQDGWETFQAYGTVDGTNFDYGAKRSAARAGMTEQGQQPQKKTLRAGYAINVQES